MTPEQESVNQGRNHNDPDLRLPAQLHLGHHQRNETADYDAAGKPHVEAAEHFVHFQARVRIGDHWVTGRFGAAVADADAKRRDQQPVEAASINGEDDAQSVHHKSHHHDNARANGVIYQTADNHGDGEAQEPHGIDEAQLFGA